MRLHVVVDGNIWLLQITVVCCDYDKIGSDVCICDLLETLQLLACLVVACSEEEEAEAAAVAAKEAEGETSEDEVVHEVAEKVREKKRMMIEKGRRDKDKNHPRHNRALLGISGSTFEKHMEGVGVDPSAALATMKANAKKRGRSLTRREEGGGDMEDDEDEDVDGEDVSTRGRSSGRRTGTTTSPRPGFRIPRGSSKPPVDEPRSRSRSRARNASRGEPVPGEGFRDAKQKVCGG